MLASQPVAIEEDEVVAGIDQIIQHLSERRARRVAILEQINKEERTIILAKSAAQ